MAIKHIIFNRNSLVRSPLMRAEINKLFANRILKLRLRDYQVSSSGKIIIIFQLVDNFQGLRFADCEINSLQIVILRIFVYTNN